MDYYSVPISVTDASSMLRSLIRINELPYTKKVIKMNNRLVDEWEKKILRKLENSKGTIPSGKVWSSWTLFKEGKEITEYSKIRHLIPRPSKEQLDFWINFFENSTIEKFHKIGVGVLSIGWGIIENEIQMWVADKKWENLFSLSDDPLVWERNFSSHQHLFKGEVFPFWNKEICNVIGKKVGTVLSLQVKPDAFRLKSKYNMRPYTKVVARLNNKMVSAWEKEVLGKVTKRDTVTKEEFERWALWYTEKCLQSYDKLRDQIPVPSSEQLNFWKDLLEKSTIEELHSRGTGVVKTAHQITQTALRLSIANQKLEKIYKQGSTFQEWEKNSQSEKILPFWDDKTLKEVSMKVGTIFTVQVTPEN